MECVYCGVGCDWPAFASAPICLGCAMGEIAEQDAAYQDAATYGVIGDGDLGELEADGAMA